MTTAIALEGQWEGLRAFPRTRRTADDRLRLIRALDRLSGLYEGMAQRATLLAKGMARIDGLRSSMIDHLDALDGDPDDEPGGDEEPSLSFASHINQHQAMRAEPIGGVAWLDLEDACEGEGAEHDGREPEEHD